jgi:hypothetical protein
MYTDSNIMSLPEKFMCDTTLKREHAEAQLVEALRYKLEGRGFDST